MIATTFAALPLAMPLQRALEELNYSIPSPIQAQAIPILLEGRDLLGCAQTGTGKTASFALPILHLLQARAQAPKPKGCRALVLTPTRELAVQVGQSFSKYGKHLRLRQTLIYGGVGQNPQIAAMRGGVDVLVATPGRLLDLIQQGFISLASVEFFVLDEVDRMLDMGFLRDVQKIVAMLPAQRQSLFFSATLAPNIVQLAEKILRDPARVRIEPETTTAERVEQQVCFVDRGHKFSLLESLLRHQVVQTEARLTIVFSRTKHGANKLAKSLSAAGLMAEAIHGNKSQAQREKALERFRKGLIPVLVATDVAARGVDVKDVGLVVNYDLPHEPEAYVHRIGRTGRAGAAGRAVSFCCDEELDDLRMIEQLIRASIPVCSDHKWHAAAWHARHQQAGAQRANPKAPARHGGGGSRNRFSGRGATTGRAPTGRAPTEGAQSGAPTARR